MLKCWTQWLAKRFYHLSYIYHQATRKSFAPSKRQESANMAASVYTFMVIHVIYVVMPAYTHKTRSSERNTSMWVVTSLHYLIWQLCCVLWQWFFRYTGAPFLLIYMVFYDCHCCRVLHSEVIHSQKCHVDKCLIVIGNVIIGIWISRMIDWLGSCIWLCLLICAYHCSISSSKWLQNRCDIKL